MIAHADHTRSAILVAAAAPTVVAAIITAGVTIILTGVFLPFRPLRSLGLRLFLRGGRVFALAVIAAATAAAASAAATAVVILARCGLRCVRQREPFRCIGAGQGLFHEAFDGRQIFVICRCRDTDRRALTAGAAGAADPVDVILGMAGQIEVEDMADRWNVQPARRHIRGDQQLQFAIAETVQRTGAVALIQIAVDRRGVIAVFRKRFGDDIDISLTVAEDDRVLQALAFGVDQGAQQFALLLGGLVTTGRRDLDQFLGDRLAGGGLPRHLDPFRRVQEGVGDPLDLGGHGGAEEQGLAGEGGQLEDAFDIGDEAHVQHPVGFVHDHDLDVGQDQLAAFVVIQQTARRRDQHVDTTVDQLVLLAEADPADQKCLGQLGIFGIGVEILGHLRGQFACRAQHQAARHTGARPAASQQRDHRQGKAGGLAGSGLRDPKHVAAFQCGRNRTGLDRSGLGITSLFDGLQNLGVNFQIGEFRHSGLSIGRANGGLRVPCRGARMAHISAVMGRSAARPFGCRARCGPASPRPSGPEGQSFRSNTLRLGCRKGTLPASIAWARVGRQTDEGVNGDRRDRGP